MSEAIDRVAIAEPDPAWPALFAEEAARLRAALGAELIAIEHIGSTAVPGLAAKPVIDIMGAFPTLGRARAALPLLAALGYLEISVGMTGRLFLRRDGGPIPVHLHLVDAESWPNRHERWMRDHLLANPAAVVSYAALKSALARQFPDDRAAYTRAKTAFVQQLIDDYCDARGRPRIDVWAN